MLEATRSEGAVAEVPSIGSCKALSFQNAAAAKWPLPLWLCHLDGQAAKETQANQGEITANAQLITRSQKLIFSQPAFSFIFS